MLPTEAAPGVPVAVELPGFHSRPSAVWTGTSHLLVWSGVKGVSALLVTPGAPAPFAVRIADGFLESTAVAVNDDGQALVVWEDRHFDVGMNIRAARLSASGALLDPTPIIVDERIGPHGTVAVASDGDGYLVVWASKTQPGGEYDELRARRFAADGTPIDAASTPIVSNIEVQGLALQHGIDEFLLVWEDGETSNVHAVILDSDGAVASTPVAMMQSPYIADEPAVAFDGTTFLVGWINGVVRAAPVSRTGVKGTSFEAAVRADQSLRLAWDGTSFRASWLGAAEISGPTGAWTQRLSTSAALGTAQRLSDVETKFEGMALSVGGDQVLAAWPDYDMLGGLELRGKRLTLDGSELDATAQVLSLSPNAESDPALAVRGVRLGMAWEDDRVFDSGSMVSATFASIVTELGSSAPVEIAPACTSPRIGGRDGRWLVACSRDNPRGVVGRWLDDAGEPQGDLVEISAFPASRLWDIVDGGERTLVLWTDDQGVAGAWVDPDGAEQRLTFDATQTFASMAGIWAGDHAVVAWVDPAYQDIYVGTLADGSLTVENTHAIGTGARGAVDFAAGDGVHLLVWMTWYGTSDYIYRVYGQRIDDDGNAIDSAQPLSPEYDAPIDPRVAWDGSAFHVTWDELDASAVEVRVAPDGAVETTPVAPVPDVPDARSVVSVPLDNQALYSAYVRRDLELGATTRVNARIVEP